MSPAAFDHEGARTIRTHWFRYLDTVEPIRAELYGYCHKLTSNIWDAEDLVQDTLLTGFGMAARGDFHGEESPIKSVKAYLFRTATNRWIDLQRRAKFQASGESHPEEDVSDPDVLETRDAIARGMQLTSPQEFVALLLKDVYDYSLKDIADFIGTTEGTVKSALNRARKKMQETAADGTNIDPALKQLVEKFVDAMNSGDMDQLINMMSEQIQISVCNVGGGRGREGNWTDSTTSNVLAKYAECDGSPVVLLFDSRDPENLYDVLRLGGDGVVTRITDYCYAPETLRHVAETLGYKCSASYYHQPWEIIENNMVPTTFLPWQD